MGESIEKSPSEINANALRIDGLFIDAMLGINDGRRKLGDEMYRLMQPQNKQEFDSVMTAVKALSLSEEEHLRKAKIVENHGQHFIDLDFEKNDQPASSNGSQEAAEMPPAKLEKLVLDPSVLSGELSQAEDGTIFGHVPGVEFKQKRNNDDTTLIAVKLAENEQYEISIGWNPKTEAYFCKINETDGHGKMFQQAEEKARRFSDGGTTCATVVLPDGNVVDVYQKVANNGTIIGLRNEGKILDSFFYTNPLRLTVAQSESGADYSIRLRHAKEGNNSPLPF